MSNFETQTASMFHVILLAFLLLGSTYISAQPTNKTNSKSADSSRTKSTTGSRFKQMEYKSDPDKYKKFPYTTTYLIANCQRENRTVTFGSGTNFISSWVMGTFDLRKNVTVNFSPSYKVDTGFLLSNVIKIQSLLPEDFWTFPMGEQQFHHEPDEKAIWFTKLFTTVDKKGYIKVLAAYKITFEGTDTRIDNQRQDPKVKNVEFILDKVGLIALEKAINAAAKASSK